MVDLSRNYSAWGGQIFDLNSVLEMPLDSPVMIRTNQQEFPIKKLVKIELFCWKMMKNSIILIIFWHIWVSTHPIWVFRMVFDQNHPFLQYNNPIEIKNCLGGSITSKKLPLIRAVFFYMKGIPTKLIFQLKKAQPSALHRFLSDLRNNLHDQTTLVLNS